VQPGDIITSGGDPADLSGIVGQAQDLTTQMKKLFTELTGLTHELREGQGTIARMIQDDGLYDSAKKAAADLSGTAHALDGTAGAFKDTANSITDTSNSYKKLGNDLRQTLIDQDGTLKKLAQDSAPFDSLNGSLAKMDTILSKLSQGEGTLGKILNDDTVAEELTGLLKDMRRLVNKIEKKPKENLKITVF